MSYYSTDNEYDGRRDYEYGDNDDYTRAFNEARREADRRQERRDQEAYEESRQLQQDAERRKCNREQENEYYNQAYAEFHQQEYIYPQPEYPCNDDDLPF